MKIVLSVAGVVLAGGVSEFVIVELDCGCALEELGVFGVLETLWELVCTDEEWWLADVLWEVDVPGSGAELDCCPPLLSVIGFGSGREVLDEWLDLPNILYRLELSELVRDCGSVTFGIISRAEPIAANMVTTEQIYTICGGFSFLLFCGMLYFFAGLLFFN